jgi:isoleucyl-tRNA synthetase
MGWDKFEGNTPHKPWIDEVKIKCSQCGKIVSRIADVGNPWLDAGIVGVSTMPSDWFPADFITESFPGQFKNWFYSLIAMSTVLKKSPPVKNILGYASLLAEDGRPMHKSWGNSIEFGEGADKIGVDVMRWMYVLQNPESNLLFGYKKADETRRQFHIMLWNIYNFFVTYANIDGFTGVPKTPGRSTNILDIWIIARLNQMINEVAASLDKYDPVSAGTSIALFVSDLSTWYVRRSRERVGPAVPDSRDKLSCHYTLYTCLVKLALVLAPITPYISEEIYKNLTGEESVHLAAWPASPKVSNADLQMGKQMSLARKIVELGLGQRKNSGLKVRQPLNLATIGYTESIPDESYQALIREELNIKNIQWIKGSDLSVSLDSELTPELLAEGQNRELIRQVQEARKAAGAKLDQKIILTAPIPQDPRLLAELKTRTLAEKIIPGSLVSVKLR